MKTKIFLNAMNELMFENTTLKIFNVDLNHLEEDEIEKIKDKLIIFLSRMHTEHHFSNETIKNLTEIINTDLNTINNYSLVSV